ncbi:MAG: MFS transporter, partial [Pseudomonadota bacterium]|nr:MFS transporter [Pseudomonadota bacterium]
PETVTRLGAGLAMLSFAAMALGPLWGPRAQLWLLAMTAIGFDLGVQAALIAHQTIVYGIDPGARSRLNAVLMVGMFIGMATGAALGSQLLATWGWSAVAALAGTASFAALCVRLWPPSAIVAAA